MAPSLRGKSIGINGRQAGASELFLNGQLTFLAGKIDSLKPSARRANIPSALSAVLIHLNNDSVQLVAVRYAFSRKQWIKVPRSFFRLRVFPAGETETKIVFSKVEHLIESMLFGAFLILGILQLLLYSTSAGGRTNLYFGIFLLAQSFQAYAILSLLRDPDLFPLSSGGKWFDDMSNIVIGISTAIAGVFYLLGIYAYFKLPKRTPFYIALILILASLPTTIFAPYQRFGRIVFLWIEYLLPYILPFFEILRVDLLAIRQGKPGARLFTTAHSILLISWILLAFSEYSAVSPFLIANGNYLFVLSFLGLAVTITLLLAEDRLATNKLLRRQLVDLEALSQKTLAQEQEKQLLLATQNERLEQQVEQRTAELKASQAQLIQKEKLASLGELTAGIAHEIQNPLNFVNNFSEVSSELVDELTQEAQAGHTEDVLAIAGDLRQNLHKIHHHGGRASAIVKGMLEHSRTDSGEKRPTGLNALADEYLKIAYQGLRAKDKSFECALLTEYEADLGEVNVVPQEIGRVLLNLYNNAFYAVRERQKQRDSSYRPTVTVLTAKTKEGIQIRVADNGRGIPETLQSKVFQPFFTTKPTGEGTGLGLSLSYDIVTKGHGGTLRVESQAGEGSTFVIELPQ
ncbi:histidine kinase [Spirosoma sp. HMF4905]|uniref:histidine kinase n=1 Tax=Spirosoma arboris TaxID=2682092 RepID=A0A7K1SPA6_9BACT|nr:ATP-binding protein [Spirosoma arboris]MVM35635.1 histidine kinase [Spirosoma arboris]